MFLPPIGKYRRGVCTRGIGQLFLKTLPFAPTERLEQDLLTGPAVRCSAAMPLEILSGARQLHTQTKVLVVRGCRWICMRGVGNGWASIYEAGAFFPRKTRCWHGGECFLIDGSGSAAL
jgi:hypothetical protein